MLLCSWKRFYASFDGSMRLEMLLCSWNQFYASLDRYVRLEMLLRSWKQFYASLDASVQHEMLLCSWKWFYASLDRSVWQKVLLCSCKRFYASFDKSVEIFFRRLNETNWCLCQCGALCDVCLRSVENTISEKCLFRVQESKVWRLRYCPKRPKNSSGKFFGSLARLLVQSI